jgi:ribosome maturation factor RimP
MSRLMRLVSDKWALCPFFIGGVCFFVLNTERVRELIDPAVTAMGYVLWGVVTISQGRHNSTLRIYIDGPEGVGVDDCARVSHQVSGILDVEDPIPTRYTLEVSSPGLDRPLFTLEQYRQFTGSSVKLRLRAPFKGQRNFSGVLAGTENDEIVLRVDDEELLLPLESIEKANIVSRDKLE